MLFVPSCSSRQDRYQHVGWVWWVGGSTILLIVKRAQSWDRPAQSRSTCCPLQPIEPNPGWSVPGKYRVGSGSWWGTIPTPTPSPRVLLGTKTCWTLTNVHTCTRTKRSVCTQHRRVFFDVRAIFKMSLGSRTAASAMAAVQQGASEARSYRQTHP